MGLQLGSIALEMVIEWSGQVGKVHNELSEVSYHPYKLSNGGVTVWFWEVNNSFYMLLARLYPVLCDAMCKVCNLISEQVAFGGFEFQVLSPEPVKYDPHVVQMIILICGKGDNIIEVDQAIGEI